ncbi:hypothetical protein YTPLAS73_09030 [Nitrosarchaeum sp.]|nr:hypothetical protein YTPLAS73_09030 [Nitrosarchaeum sp.]
MTNEFTQTFLVGEVENFSTTIKGMVSTDWDNTKTQSTTPLMISGESLVNTQHRTAKAEAVTFDEGSTIPIGISSALDDSQIGMATQIVITIHAANQYRRTLFQNEINRIIRKNRPAKGTRIKKSNGTEDSAIAGFVEILPQWNPVDFEMQKSKRDSSSRQTDYELRKNSTTSKSQGILTVTWQNKWNP